MLMEINKILIFGFLIIGCVTKGFAKPVDNEKSSVADDNYNYEDLQGHDDYTYYDEDKSDGIDNMEILANNTIDPPYFERPENSEQVNAGDDVILKCDVNNLRINNVVMWYKGEHLIIQGGHILALDGRIMDLPNNAMKIRNVSSSDTNDYYCQVLPENIRQHTHLNVLQAGGPGRVAIFTHDRDVTERSMTLQQGDKIELECRAFGLENAQLKWSLNGFRAKEHVSEIVDGKLTIYSVDAEHAGRYQCLGDDGSSKLPMASVTLNVLYAPKVTTHRHHINTEIGAKTELTCEYKAEPIAVVYWKKSNVRLETFSDKYTVLSKTVKGKNRTTLYIKDVDISDLGEYECEAKNSVASSSMKIQLALTPENPQFESMEINGRKATLHWLVRSMQPLSDAILDYKLDGSFTWSSETIITTRKHPEHTGFWKLTHSIELTPGLWHARVKTENTAGWSKFSVAHDFKIDDGNSEDIASSPDDIIGGGGGGGVEQKEINKATFNLGGADSAIKLHLMPSLILGFSLLLILKTYLVR